MLGSLQICVSPLFVFLYLAFLLFFSFISFVFLLFLLLSISIWRHFVSSSLFSCRYYDVASVSVATRLAYVWYVSDTCIRTLISPFYFCLRYRYTICKLCVRTYRFYSVFIRFPPQWGNLPLQSYWSLSCDHALHCSDELMWGQQQHIRSIWHAVAQARRSTLYDFHGPATSRLSLSEFDQPRDRPPCG